MDKLSRHKITNDSDLTKAYEIFKQNWRLFVICLVIVTAGVTLLNRLMIPRYAISASLLIKEDGGAAGGGGDMNDFLSSSLFGKSQNFQNELWVLKSTPVISQTVYNLNLTTKYYRSKGLQYYDAYDDAPFRVLMHHNHVQPIGVKFHIIIKDNSNFLIESDAKSVQLYNYESHTLAGIKADWQIKTDGVPGKLIETPEMSFIVEFNEKIDGGTGTNDYYFEFLSDHATSEYLKSSLEYKIIDSEATVVQISLKSESIEKGKDIVNEVMEVYSRQSLDRKNHTAENTIAYIESQLNEISEVLSETEDTLQSFRASNQILNVTEQASGISRQYMDLQNQLAELTTRKKYYDYVSEYLAKNEDFSNMIVPASMGIPDQMLNNLMSELVTAFAQRTNLIANKQEKNPLVNRLTIQIENLRNTITENISEVQKTTEISVDEMKKRIGKIEAQIRTMPVRQRQLGGIERTYRLSDAIYNYLLQKRAEAQITKASNMPDNIIIEPAEVSGQGPISPNKRLNYMAGFFLGIMVPFSFILIRRLMNNKIVSISDIENLTSLPVIGTIIHNPKKADPIVFKNASSEIAESYRSLRTNIEYRLKKISKRVILITSTVEDEGKSFTALNLAMSYSQLKYKTILVDFDLRKPSSFSLTDNKDQVGLSSFYTGNASVEDIIFNTPYPNFDMISSGAVAPNPIELLSLPQTGELIQKLREQYDCIVLDTTPLAQVSDAYQLIEHADLNLIVVRQSFTIKQILGLIMKDLDQKKVTNVCIVLNDNREYAGQYGYQYGYAKKSNRKLRK